MSVSFLLDEHVDHAIQRQLRRLAPELEALAVGDDEAPERGTSDPDLLLWLELRGFVLVTENRSTMPVHLASHLEAGRHVPGVIWIRPNTSIGQIIEELYLIWLVSTEEDFQDRTLFIPL